MIYAKKSKNKKAGCLYGKSGRILFFGTGNTEYVINRLCNCFIKAGIDCKVYSIENFENQAIDIDSADTVIIAYPIYASSMTLIMKDFLNKNAPYFLGKKLITVCTQALFSGDGAALAKRMLKKQISKHIASIHIKMPNNISDNTIFKVKNGENNAEILKKADNKIDNCAQRILDNKAIRNGRGLFSWILGFFGQRLFWQCFFEKKLNSLLKIDKGLCVRCGKCVEQCPTKNIEIKNNNINSNCSCIACYRCINLCPKKAISLLSNKKPQVQYKGINQNGNQF